MVPKPSLARADRGACTPAFAALLEDGATFAEGVMGLDVFERRLLAPVVLRDARRTGAFSGAHAWRRSESDPDVLRTLAELDRLDGDVRAHRVDDTIWLLRGETALEVRTDRVLFHSRCPNEVARAPEDDKAQQAAAERMWQARGQWPEGASAFASFFA